MKAIALFSGGLDSTLAMKLIIDQGIEVIACNINTGFGSTKDRLSHMKNMCEQVGAEFRSVDIRDEYIREVLFTPKYGYGKNFNPCIDCHGKMFEVAKRKMEEWGASFLISGEVLGQRPMSQNSESLQKVLNLSNCEGLLLRPLSAQALEPTIPELEGWVDRDKLENIVGRNRDRQMELAELFGLKDYEAPGGGCLLTDEKFSNKIRDFIAHDTMSVEDIPTLKYGRQLRLPDGAKFIIGRNAEDNAVLEAIVNPKYVHIHTELFGPHSLISHNASENDKMLAAKLMLAYCKPGFEGEQTLMFGEESLTTVSDLTRNDAAKYFI
ncbi:argininosuccinate synthase domain-containing protein [Sulfuricurvum sp.]|uniref:argininosuccinate synthase domain-containing protein n=1 Tax=Sulfuricurvum sp. TaxID=2025608 RepID=UPI002613039D|nr:argininosuccinate synthase domain-containing protein [Sulfuricurvum sp.]MDD2267820.1 argininosuccinate synthase [Sulfuricurvum sp.]MDD2783510.1 argininosuccinate synthase [Sulfuricurvum sp.]